MGPWGHCRSQSELRESIAATNSRSWFDQLSQSSNPRPYGGASPHPPSHHRYWQLLQTVIEHKNLAETRESSLCWFGDIDGLVRHAESDLGPCTGGHFLVSRVQRPGFRDAPRVSATDDQRHAARAPRSRDEVVAAAVQQPGKRCGDIRTV